MYTLILLISLTVFGYIFGALLYGNRYGKDGRYHEGREGFGVGLYVIAICATSALIIACCDFINLKGRFQRTLYDYENTVRIIETYEVRQYAAARAVRGGYQQGNRQTEGLCQEPVA